MKKKVVAVKNEKTKLPIEFTALCWMLMDRFHAIGWVKGMAWTLIAVIWIGLLYNIWIEEEVDIFAEK